MVWKAIVLLITHPSIGHFLSPLVTSLSVIRPGSHRSVAGNNLCCSSNSKRLCAISPARWSFLQTLFSAKTNVESTSFHLSQYWTRARQRMSILLVFQLAIVCRYSRTGWDLISPAWMRLETSIERYWTTLVETLPRWDYSPSSIVTAIDRCRRGPISRRAITCLRKAVQVSREKFKLKKKIINGNK